MLDPDTFGAVGDGRTDDTTALQAALYRAEGTGVRLKARTYLVRDTLLLPSNAVLEGYGATIVLASHDRPILASLAWGQSGRTLGHTRIRGLSLRGTGQGERQDGIVLYDFWSEIADVEITDVGGRGIVLTDEDRKGKRPSGTLVENRIRNCIVRNARRSAFWLGRPANGKLTDGELTGCLAGLADGAREPALFIGHAAGWTVRGLHTYGGFPRAACEIVQPYFTTLADLYIEGFEQAGLSLQGIQTSVAVANVHMIAQRPARGAAFLALDAHRDFANPVAMVTNLALWHEGPNLVSAARVGERPVAVMAQNVAVRGSGAARVAPDALGAAGAPAPAEAAPARAMRRLASWTGRAAQKVEIAAWPAAEAPPAGFLVFVSGRSTDGGLATGYSGSLTCAGSGPGRPVLVDLVDMAAPQGFQRAPEAVVELREGQVAVSLTFTPAASGRGQLSVF